MNATDLGASVGSNDPAVGRRAVGQLHRPAEQVENVHVRLARGVGLALGAVGEAFGSLDIRPHATHTTRGSR